MTDQVRLDPEIKAKWITALRSGKYKQTTNTLKAKDGSGFCCLGVLCDLAAADGNGSWKNAEASGIIFQDSIEDGSLFYLTPGIVRWAAGQEVNGKFTKEFYDLKRQLAELSVLNDAGKAFSHIATIIEAQF